MLNLVKIIPFSKNVHTVTYVSNLNFSLRIISNRCLSRFIKNVCTTSLAKTRIQQHSDYLFIYLAPILLIQVYLTLGGNIMLGQTTPENGIVSKTMLLRICAFIYIPKDPHLDVPLHGNAFSLNDALVFDMLVELILVAQGYLPSPVNCIHPILLLKSDFRAA